MRIAWLAVTLAAAALPLAAQPFVDGPSRDVWVATWAASPHGPYPAGTAVAQPDLRFAIPDADRGLADQTVRLIVRPDLWGRTVRLRFSNAVGTRPLRLDAVYVGLQARGGTVARGTNQPVRFGGRSEVAIPPGTAMYSDAVSLPFVTSPDDPLLAGRRLAVSLHVAGESGPITWHSKAMATSYLSTPGAGPRGDAEDESAFPYTARSWFWLDVVEVRAPPETLGVVAFGDSITDGTGSTLEEGDRWPDVLSARLHVRLGSRVSVVNAGIGGNRVVRTEAVTPAVEARAGPPAVERVGRDVLGLGGVKVVLWLEGINDLAAGTTAAQVIAGLQVAAAQAHARGLRLLAGTLPPALGAETAHGTPGAEAQRQAVNAFIRRTEVFDGVVDFDAALRDPQTGRLRPQFVPDSAVGGPGDWLHPNRAGYRAMGEAVDLDLVIGSRK